MCGGFVDMCVERRRTAREETIFGEDCDCVDEEDGNCVGSLAFLSFFLFGLWSKA